MRLSIIIPVFNEKENISNVIDTVMHADSLSFEKEIIVVDDCSTDGSREILKKRTDITVLFAEKNGGKGAAVKLGLTKATGDYVLFQDADLEYSTDNYKDLLKEISTKNDVVFGSRNLKKNKRNHLHLASDTVTLIFNSLFGTKITDIATCYKVFPASLIPKILEIKENDFVFDVIQVTKIIIKSGITIKEVPIFYNPRSYEQGKKMRIKHGLHIALATVKEGLRYRFNK
jgi:glycosyltransferase involved in cell wall biosynthesis